MVDEYQTEEIRKTVTETTAGSPEGEGSGSGAAVVNGTGGDPMMERMEKDTGAVWDETPMGRDQTDGSDLSIYQG